MTPPRATRWPFVVSLAACQAAPDASGREFVHEAITSLHVDASGVAWIGFGAMARAFTLRAGDAALLAFARTAHATGAHVFATARSDGPPKTVLLEANPAPDPRGHEILRLAATPDPRAPV